MPRPKRTKISHPAPINRVATSNFETPVDARAKAKAKAEAAEFDKLYDVSDEAEGVVTSARRVKKGNRSAPRGVVAKGKQANTQEKATEAEDDLSEVDGDGSAERSHAVTIGDLELDESSIETEAGRRDTTTSRVENSVLNIGNFRRRPREPSILGRGNDRASSVESVLAETNGLSTVGRRGRYAMGRQRSQAREPSVESGNEVSRSSSPALGRNAPAQVDSAMRLTGLKRRERQPSILGTAQKHQQARPIYDFDEEDFNPEDASTPLNLSKTRVRTNSSPQLSNPRKRKQSPNQEPESSPARQSENEQSPERPSVSLGNPEDSEDADEDQPLPSTERSPTPEVLSDKFAPPRSSPSLPSPHALRHSTATQARNAKIRTPLPPPQTSSSLPSSPPSLTHSPNYPTRGRGRSHSKPPPATFSTAQLTALLPRRRRTRAPTHDPFAMLPSSEDEEEIDATGLGEDEDELSHLDARARVRGQGRRKEKKAATAIRKPVSKLKPKPFLKAKTKPKQPAPAKDVAKEKGKVKAKRTYGSTLNNTSDKENSPHPSTGSVIEVDMNDSLAPLPDNEAGEEDRDESSQELEKRVGKELKRAKRKFEVVDRWELEFEEETASGSSPAFRDAR